MFICNHLQIPNVFLSDPSKQIRATEGRPRLLMNENQKILHQTYHILGDVSVNKQDFVTSAVALKRADGFGPSPANDTMELEYMW